MATPHYSLRWNNHQNHILNAFDTLLQSETLVDVTLVCEETSVRAHKVVLSACRSVAQSLSKSWIFCNKTFYYDAYIFKHCETWTLRADQIRTQAAEMGYWLRAFRSEMKQRNQKKICSIYETMELYKIGWKDHILRIMGSHSAKLHGFTSL
jgi:hypothetical protein